MKRYTHDSPLPFGKYKGQSLNEVVAKDEKYLIWLKHQNWLRDPIKRLLDEWVLCGLCGDHTEGMYAGEDIYIKCPGCGHG